MNEYDRAELAYKNGYRDGQNDEKTQEYLLLKKIENMFGAPCNCGACYLPFHAYCPGCGKKVNT